MASDADEHHVQAMAKAMSKVVLDYGRRWNMPFARCVELGLHAYETVLAAHICTMEKDPDARIKLMANSLTQIMADIGRINAMERRDG